LYNDVTLFNRKDFTDAEEIIDRLCGGCCAFFATNAAAEICVEHMVLDVAAPEVTAKWWCENLGFYIQAKLPAPPYAIFIVNSSGNFAMELYRDPNTPDVPDYHKMSPDKMHIAFVSDDLDGDVRRLAAAGATLRHNPGGMLPSFPGFRRFPAARPG